MPNPNIVFDHATTCICSARIRRPPPTGMSKAKGVEFSVEPRDNNPTTRLAFINAPDGVSVELLNRKDMA